MSNMQPLFPMDKPEQFQLLLKSKVEIAQKYQTDITLIQNELISTKHNLSQVPGMNTVIQAIDTSMNENIVRYNQLNDAAKVYFELTQTLEALYTNFSNIVDNLNLPETTAQQPMIGQPPTGQHLELIN